MQHGGVLPLRARDLHCTYRGNEWVLRGVNLHVSQGELVGILGPNGSGKSTLIQVLSGVLRPQRGVVELFGRPLAELSPREVARCVAVVPQDTHVEFPFSVLEIVLMGRAPYLAGFSFEGTDDLAAAERAMERTGVAHLARRAVQELSGGERQRVFLARALAQDTPLLLLDEPGAFLDLHHVVEIYDLLRDLLEEGKSVVTVLHDLNLVSLYCDRVVLLHRGEVFRSGSPAEVITYEAITTVYDTEVYVDLNDLTGAVNVLPLSRPYRERLRDHRVPRQESSKYGEERNGS